MYASDYAIKLINLALSRYLAPFKRNARITDYDRA